MTGGKDSILEQAARGDGDWEGGRCEVEDVREIVKEGVRERCGLENEREEMEPCRGLSKFRSSNLQLSSQRLQPGDPLTAQVEVKNESGPDGDEVVEVYLTPPKIPGATIRALRGLERIHLRAGETGHVKITLSPRDLSLVNRSGDRLVSPGEYQLSLGGGQPTATSAVVSGKFTIEGEQKLP